MDEGPWEDGAGLGGACPGGDDGEGAGAGASSGANQGEGGASAGAGEGGGAGGSGAPALSAEVLAAVGAEARRARPRTRGTRYAPEVAQRLLARVALGETVAQVCRDPEMPTQAGVTHWAQTRPVFAEALEAARASGRWTAPYTRYCDETFEQVWLRVCLGEGVAAVCASDPALPDVRTFYRWVKARPELQAALRLAREIQGDRLAEEGLADARTVTSSTARGVEVKLRHLRWFVARLAPVKYGPGRGVAPVEDEVRPPPPKPPRLVSHRDFWVEARPGDGWRRVRASYVEPETGRIVDEPPGPWEPPPKGGEDWLAQWAAVQAKNEADAAARAAAKAAARGPTPPDRHGPACPGDDGQG